MKKVYIISWHGKTDIGGVERVTQYLYDIYAEDYAVTIIDFAMAEQNSVIRKLLHIHYALDSILMSIYANWFIHKSKEEKIIITQGYNAPFVKMDYVFAHGTMKGFKLAMGHKYQKWHFNELFERHSMRKASKVIAVSGRVKEEVNKLYGVNEKSIIVAENCVDTKLFYPIDKTEKNEMFTILFVGRLEEMKGIKALIQLAEEIERREDIVIRIATTSEENALLFENLKKTIICTKLSLSQMQDFYHEGDVLFFPSLYEGFGLACLEALACGVPIVGSACVMDNFVKYGGGVKEAIITAACDNFQNILDELIALGLKYRSIDKKRALHKMIEKNYGIESYKKKIRGIIAE